MTVLGWERWREREREKEKGKQREGERKRERGGEKSLVFCVIPTGPTSYLKCS